MDEKLFEIKTGVLVFFSALGTVLGWKGLMALVWVLAMALDYLSGTAAACKEGTWSSTTARTGLWHKGGMILVVLVAAMADGILSTISAGMSLLWPGALLPLVVMWYIITELGSILENAVKLGVQVPQWLKKALEISLEAVDGAGKNHME